MGRWLTPRPGRFTLRKEAGWAAGSVWTDAESLGPSPGFNSRTFQPVASHYTNYGISPHVRWFVVKEIVVLHKTIHPLLMVVSLFILHPFLSHLVVYPSFHSDILSFFGVFFIAFPFHCRYVDLQKVDINLVMSVFPSFCSTTFTGRILMTF